MKVKIPSVKKSMSATQSKLACGNLSEFPNPEPTSDIFRDVYLVT